MDCLVVTEKQVIGRQHFGIRRSHRDGDARLSDRRNGLDVIPVPMGFDHLGHAELATKIQQEIMFVCRINQEPLTGPLATNDEHIVLDRSNDHFLHVDSAICVDLGERHEGSLAGKERGVLERCLGRWVRLLEPSTVRHHSRCRLFEYQGVRMNFVFTEEQDELRKAVNRFLAEKSPETEVRRLMETSEGYDTAVWTQMAEQLGLQSLSIPEEFGGAGFTFVETAIVLEEMGASLLCAPFFSTVVLAAQALLTSGDDAAKAEYLPGIADGSTIATLAITEDNGRPDLDAVATTATHDGAAWTLSGHKNYVIDGHLANLILVVAKSSKGLSLFAVDGDASGLTRSQLPTMDQTRKQARLEFANTPARLIGEDGGAAAGLSKALDLIAVGLAAEQVGGAQRCLDASVDYAKNRIQFGRPIGSFQAIKHKCADMLLEVESAKSAAYYAAFAAADDSDELPVVASLAKSYCSEAYFHAAAENIQIHGGIGFTWEHPAHLYFKRAKSSELLFGDPTYHREQLAQRIGL